MRTVRDPAEAARLRAEMHRQRVLAARSVDFPVYQAVGCGLPVLFGYSMSSSSVVHLISVFHGDFYAPVAVAVWTEREAEPDLDGYLEQLRAGGDEPHVVREQRAGWTVTVGYRGLAEPPKLAQIGDLVACAQRQPDWQERMRQEMLRRHPPLPPPELEPAPGTQAHRMLIDYVLDRTGSPDKYWRPLFERAFAHQVQLNGQGEQAAEDAVTTMVNQCARLARDAEWFTEARTEVIEQCVQFAIGEPVETVAAQDLWYSSFGRSIQHAHDHTDQQRFNRERLRSRERWLAEWQRWYDTRD